MSLPRPLPSLDTTGDDKGSGPVHWHELAPEEALSRLNVSRDGLSRAEASRRLAQFGPNSLPEQSRASLFMIFLGQFKSPLIYLLFAASVAAFLLGERSDAIVILAVVLINSLIGTIQEGRAARSIESLRALSRQKALVKRDRHELTIEARDLVPGDVLVLHAGDAISADARLFETSALEVSEAALTGESVPVAKSTAPLPHDALLADRKNMVYAGTHITAGRALAVVTATGNATEVGKIANLTAGAEESQTPLERKIEHFSRQLILAALLLFSVILGVGYLRELPFGTIFMVGISQIVSMIPEGLPVAMTVALAVGVQRMASRRAVIRRLAAVETLGSTNVICTDKTGTLTRNEMTVKEILLPGQGPIQVSGSGYKPEGALEPVPAGSLAPGDPLYSLLRTAALCNDSQLNPPSGDSAGWSITGDPTEAALLTVAEKAGLELEKLREIYPRQADIPFDPSKKLMVTEHGGKEGTLLLIKGAPESILDLCTSLELGNGSANLDSEWRARLTEAAGEMASRALRVLGFAEIRGEGLNGATDPLSLKGRAVFLGFLGQIDPPREEARVAVEQCRNAGIRPVMVTGDHKLTGRAIGEMIGIVRPGDLAVDGRELEKMGDRELEERLDQISVFARVHPAQKLRIVNAFQSRGAVVAMTGDGVNDAPALAQANVGVAMGITGTDVAKEASKMVITDDNFATIVDAVKEGRLVYANIKKLILYLFTTGVGEILVLLSALIFGYPPPLAAVQILWINVVTDGALTVTLIMEPAEGDEMKRPPTRLGESLITRSMLRRMLFLSTSIAISTLGYFIYGLGQGRPFAEVQTETFTLLAVAQWFNVLNCRSATRSVFGMSLLRNPWLIGGLLVGNALQASVIYIPFLNGIFHTRPVPIENALMIGLVASLVLWVEELRKLYVRRRMKGGISRLPGVKGAVVE